MLTQEQRDELNRSAVEEGFGCHPSYVDTLESVALDSATDYRTGRNAIQIGLIARAWDRSVDQIIADLRTVQEAS